MDEISKAELILNNLYNNQEYFKKFKEHIEPACFNDFGSHKAIHQLIVDCYEANNMPPSIGFLRLNVEASEDVEFLVQPIVLAVNELETITQQWIEEKHIKHVVRTSIDKIECATTLDDFLEIKSFVREAMNPLFDDSGRPNITTFDSLADIYRQDIENSNPVIDTGYSALNEDTNQFRKPSLVTYIAGSYVGKTNIMINQAIKMANNGQKVVYIHFEMSEEQIRKRIFSISGNICLDDIDFLPPETISERLEGLSVPNLKQIQLGVGSNSDDIKKVIENLELDVVFVDYIAFLEPLKGTSRDNSYRQQSQVCLDLIRLGKELNVCVVTASQLNRDGNEKNIEDINRNHLADCIDVFNKSDVCLALSLKSALAGEREDTCIFYKVLKNRFGQTEKINPQTRLSFGKLFFDKQTLKVYDTTMRSEFITDTLNTLELGG